MLVAREAEVTRAAVSIKEIVFTEEATYIKAIIFTDGAIDKETANTMTAFILTKEVTVTQVTGDRQVVAARHAIVNPKPVLEIVSGSRVATLRGNRVLYLEWGIPIGHLCGRYHRMPWCEVIKNMY